jgi:hypothetical protein
MKVREYCALTTTTVHSTISRSGLMCIFSSDEFASDCGGDCCSFPDCDCKECYECVLRCMCCRWSEACGPLKREYRDQQGKGRVGRPFLHPRPDTFSVGGDWHTENITKSGFVDDGDGSLLTLKEWREGGMQGVFRTIDGTVYNSEQNGKQLAVNSCQ